MIKIAICDDDISAIKTVTQLLLGVEKSDLYENSLQSFSSSTQLFKLLQTGESFDVFLLDVVMPEINGIALGEYILQNQPKAKIIYLSATKEFAVESYMVNAFYYMLKPLKECEFHDVVARALKEIALDKSSPKYVPVETSDGVVAVEFDTISYCLMENRRVKYILKDNKPSVESKVLRGSFDEGVSILLATKRFAKCNAHCVVNLGRVKIIESDSVTMQSGEKIKVSRALKNALNTAYFDYYFKKLEEN